MSGAKTIRYVALLRGINVGGNSIVSMAALKACFEKLGFADVRTYINSGNVIFSSVDKDADGLVAKIEGAIKKVTGLDVKATLRTAAQMKATAKKVPADWKNDEDMRCDVLFLWKEIDSPKVLKEIKTNHEVDRLIYAKGAVIWSFDRVNYGKSRMNKIIGTPVYKLTTGRNVNTVRKLCELMGVSGSINKG